MTKFTYSSARKISKYSAVILGLFVGFGFMASASATNTGMVEVTCANGTFTVGWDNSNQYFADKGNIAAYYCFIIQHTDYVSDNLSDPTLRYYQGVLPQGIPTAIVETQTVVVLESQTPSTSVESPTADNQPQSSETLTNESQTATQPSQPDAPSSETSTPLNGTDSATSVVDTSTSILETSTATVETGTVEINPLPTPIPVVEPQPVPVVVEPQPAPQPQPEPAPEPAPLPVEPPKEEPAPEPAPPAIEEQPPAEQPSEPPVAEDTNEIPLPPAPEEQPSPTPEPEPQPVVKPEPTSPPDIAPEPPVTAPQVIEASSVDVSTLPPDTPVLLDNGVILTAEVVVALQLLENPAELLGQLFTNPAQVLTAVSNIGADMSPEVRAKSEKVVVSAIIAGGIAVQSAASVAGAAAYRRKL